MTANMKLILLLVFLHFVCNSEHLQGENVGTVLFSDADNLRKCWPREKVSLLTSRMMFQDVLPKRTALKMADEQFITALIAYFRMMVDTVKKKTSGKSKDIMLQALTDALGGYLHHLALPMGKHAFYMGSISYESVRKLYDLYEELVGFLRTNGRFWLPPITNFAEMNHAAKLEPLPAPDNEKTDPCSGLIYSENQDGSITVPMPFFDSKNLPNSIAVPFRTYSLRNLQSKNTAYVLVKYYTTSVSCLKHKKASKSNTDKFNSDCEGFIEDEVIPHLNDDKLYPAFGSVYRVLKSANTATGHKSKHLDAIESGLPVKNGNKVGAQESTLDSVFHYLGDRNRRILFLPIMIVGACLWLIFIILYCFCKHRKKSKGPKKQDTSEKSSSASVKSKKSKTAVADESIPFFDTTSTSQSSQGKRMSCDDRSKCVPMKDSSSTSSKKEPCTPAKMSPKSLLGSRVKDKRAQSTPIREAPQSTPSSSLISEKTEKPIVFGYDFETSSSDYESTDDTSRLTSPT